jgi:3-methyl-2-oxobutanoate hydroxymethyltransferase
VAKKLTSVEIRARKQGGPKIAAVTAYDATMARLLDEAEADVLLVGDSVGMVVQGHPNTLSVTVDDIVYHTRAVRRGTERAHIVSDMPFMSYQISVEDALRAAARLIKEGGAETVKVEGAGFVCEVVERLVGAGIPVMGHVGLTPQSLHKMGGFRVQGKSRDARQRIVDEAHALERAGVYSIVLEGVPEDLAREVTAQVGVPTIGIGAGPHCDGQVLVCYDYLGMFRGLKPKFVKRYAELGDAVARATREYVEEVRAGVFPGASHSFHSQPQVEESPAVTAGSAPKSAQGYGPEPEE